MPGAGAPSRNRSIYLNIGSLLTTNSSVIAAQQPITDWRAGSMSKAGRIDEQNCLSTTIANGDKCLGGTGPRYKAARNVLR